MVSNTYKFAYLLFALLLAVSLVLPAAKVKAAAQAQEYTYEECSRADESVLRGELQSLGHDILAREGDNIDVAAIVQRKWTELGVSAVLDAEVEAAIARVRSESSYWERFLSGWSPEQAEALAARVSAYTFESPTLQGKLSELSDAIAAELAREVETMSALSASSALLCMQAYVGEHYSSTLFALFQSEIGQQIESENLAVHAGVAVSPLSVHTKALGGAGIIVATQITRQLAQALAKKIAGRMAGKIAGRVLGRLGASAVPVAGWIIGAGLIVWDLVEGAEGALPQIRTALQSEDVKLNIQTDIANTVRAGLDEELQTIAATLAAILVDQWQELCTRYPYMCTLSQTNPNFKAFLGLTPLSEIGDVTALVEFFMTSLSLADLERALATGTFQALARLPEPPLDLLRATGSPDEVLAWAAIAGDSLDRVAAMEIYKWKKPGELDSALLSALFAIENEAALGRLLTLEPGALRTLAALGPGAFQSLANTASAEELVWMADYLVEIEPAESLRIAGQLAAGEQTVETLRSAPEIAAPDTSVAAAGSNNGSPAVETAAQVDTKPGVVLPALATGRHPWYENSVLIGALLILAALLMVGIIRALREQPR
jgi:hypothetical protein